MVTNVSQDTSEADSTEMAVTSHQVMWWRYREELM
jgi:hypothetical protein